MTVTLSGSPASVKRGDTVTYTITIQGPAQVITGIGLELRSRLQATTVWSVVWTGTTATDATGKSVVTQAFVVPSTLAYGVYEIMCHGTVGTAFEDSNIISTTVSEAAPPPPDYTWLIIAAAVIVILIGVYAYSKRKGGKK